MKTKTPLRNFLLIGILILCLFLFIYLRLYDYLSFDYLKTHHDVLRNFVYQHFLLSVLIFILIYIFIVAISAPGAIFLSLLGGFLFGTFFGTIFVLIGATLGAAVIFYAVKHFFYDSFYQRTGKWYQKMSTGFNKNAISYLLFLRFVPLFPFWLVNIVPAFFGVKMRTFLWTTCLGILPGTIVYVSLGRGLGFIFEQNQSPSLAIIFQTQILFPILGLALLSLTPIIYKRIKR